MKYIESKLNPDGTYDHSEVIEAHKKGAEVQYLTNERGLYRYTKWIPKGHETSFGKVKYRAQAPDTYGIQESSSTLREGGPAVAEMLPDRIKELEAVRNGGDFPEDFGHENGNYSCQCQSCGKVFKGHKRRVICKLCEDQPAQPSDTEES